MHVKSHIRRLPLLLCSLAVVATSLVALGGATTALASTAIYGSGAAVQKSIQELWIKESGSNVIYNSTNSAAGFEEFGNFSGKLSLKADEIAAKSTLATLDGYVAVDNAPTGPESTAGTNLAFAQKASGGPFEITIPVAQTPLALLLSIPSCFTSVTGGVQLSDALAAEVYAGTVPAAGGYPANSWGALLTLAGASFVATQSCGETAITVEVRSDGAGATLVLKQFFNDVDSTDWLSEYINENTEETKTWPTLATKDGFNTSDTIEAEKTASTPGEVGYSTLASATPLGFTKTATLSTSGGSASHDILYAELQDNFGDTPTLYADPESGTLANIYIGANIALNNATLAVGNWLVPETSGKLNPTGQWATSLTNPTEYTHAWDPDVLLDVSATNTITYYPLVILLWDLSWNEGFNTDNLLSQYFEPAETQATTLAYLLYVTNPNTGSVTAATSGQYVATNNTLYFAPLPTGGTGTDNIQEDAHKAAEGI